MVSCGHIPIKNQEWCGDLGQFGADCFNTLNENHRQIFKEDWDKERFGMLCTKASNFADVKETILKLCRAYKNCTYERTTSVIKFNDKVNEYVINVKNLRKDNGISVYATPSCAL